jgi:DNA modification methylase
MPEPTGAYVTSEPYYEADGITLYLGDCTTQTGWLAADVLVTDPPYGISYVRGGDRKVMPKQPVVGDHDTTLRDTALGLWGDRPAPVFGSWRAPRPANTRQLLVWWKRSVGPGSGDVSIPWGNATEEIYVLGSGYAGRRRPNVIETFEARQNAARLIGHPSNKSVSLMQQLIEACPPGLVADPFAGSGSTLLAARALGRSAIGVEIDERYCEVIAKRLAQADLFGGAA